MKQTTNETEIRLERKRNIKDGIERKREREREQNNENRKSSKKDRELVGLA